jgi:hypothetical protein
MESVLQGDLGLLHWHRATGVMVAKEMAGMVGTVGEVVGLIGSICTAACWPAYTKPTSPTVKPCYVPHCSREQSGTLFYRVE